MRHGISLATAMFAFTLLLGSNAAAASGYPGTYLTTRPGAQGTQSIVLVLEPNGRATMTTAFPELVRNYGAGVLPVRETGTWRERGGNAEVRLTEIGLFHDGKLEKQRSENKDFAFSRTGCRLSAVRYSKVLYGEAGLTFEKSGCTG